MKDRTVSLHGRLYEVDAILVGQSITLRYDPQAPASRPLQVVHDGRPVGQATRLDAYANTAVIGAFKPIADFDWTWPKRIDRLLIEELFSLAFVDDATNIVLVGPNGVGKSMLDQKPPPPRRPQRLHRPIHHRLGHAP